MVKAAGGPNLPWAERRSANRHSSIHPKESRHILPPRDCEYLSSASIGSSTHWTFKAWSGDHHTRSSNNKCGLRRNVDSSGPARSGLAAQVVGHLRRHKILVLFMLVFKQRPDRGFKSVVLFQSHRLDPLSAIWRQKARQRRTVQRQACLRFSVSKLSGRLLMTSIKQRLDLRGNLSFTLRSLANKP